MQTAAFFRLRPVAAGDEDFLTRLYHDAHAEEFAPLGLAEPQLAALLDMQARAQREGYRRENPQAVDCLVVDEMNAPIGRLLVDRSSARVLLVDLALVAAARGRGIGTELLQSLMAECAELRRPLVLHVRPGNRAFHLYTRLGFVVRGGGANIEMEYLPAVLRAEAPSLETSATAPGRGWAGAVGASFAVLGLPATEPVHLHLQLQRLERPRGAGPDTFSLFFLGPLERRLTQGTYDLQRLSGTGEGASLDFAVESIFLVPVALLEPGVEYEAVFHG